MNRQIIDIQAQSKAKAIELATKQLNSSDSLKNLKELKASVQKQNEIIKNKLKTVLNGQIEEADTAMKTLKSSTEAHSIVQNYFRQINQTGKHSQELFDNYSLLRRTIITMSNIKKAKDSLDRILQFQNEINSIYDLLEKDHTQVFIFF
jgi:arginyl-tRNA--protein-N-Asp/Glu arginylyltransferase